MSESLVGFILAVLIVEATPGPNMGYLAILSMQHGVRAGIASVIGIAFGLLTVGLLSVMGVAAFISHYPAFYTLLYYGGTLYLLWLAYDSWRAPTVIAPTENLHRITTYRHFFWRGVMVNLLNPKAAAFYLTVLPGFVTSSTSSHQEAVLFTGIYVGIATSIHLVIVAFASRLSSIFITPDKQKFIRRTMALLLIGVAGWFMLTAAHA